MPDLPRLPAKVVRFHWEEIGNLDARRRVPVIDVQVDTENGPVLVGHEMLAGSLEVRRYTAIRSPLVGVIAEDMAQAFVDARREKVRALFGANHACPSARPEPLGHAQAREGEFDRKG